MPNTHIVTFICKIYNCRHLGDTILPRKPWVSKSSADDTGRVTSAFSRLQEEQSADDRNSEIPGISNSTPAKSTKFKCKTSVMFYALDVKILGYRRQVCSCKSQIEWMDFAILGRLKESSK
ncbi:hypothetical protein JTE90_008193 [Oedothorax gibbosus]|uniref:Uncharacterized protein n=1 Tax=Oedothorax gibbosus TaxID=931172 RepID=A0AAV6VET9_9ARAC|nr:hypothetical protein JTE90_008193 [Oedothorax gibbosus]